MHATVRIPNPWQSFDTFESAEACAGFALGLPAVLSETCRADVFRVLKGSHTLLAVGYQADGHEVEVRKAAGEGQSISGVYGGKETETTVRNGVTVRTFRVPGVTSRAAAMLITFDYNGFSWSLYAPEGFPGDSLDTFLRAIFSPGV